MQDRLAAGPAGVAAGTVTESVPNHTKWFAQAGIVFALIPYIGVGALPSDTQPVAFIVAAVGVGLLLMGSRLRVSYLALPLVVMALLATVSLILQGAFDDTGYIWLARSYYGYISAPVIVTFFLYYFRVLRSEEIARAVDVALVAIFVGFLLNGLGLTWLIQVFVNRSIVPDPSMARGLASLFPEMGFVSEQMAMCFFCYVLIGHVTKTRVVAIVAASVIAAAGQMFIVFAHVVLAYGLASVLLVFLRKGLSVRSVTSLMLAGVLVSGFMSAHQVIAADLIRLGFPSRGITAISGIIKDGRTFIGRDEGMMDKLAGTLQAAATLRDNPAAFKLAATADKELHIATVGQTYARLLRVLFDSDILMFQRRPSTALGLWIIEFGVVGLLAALSVVGLLLWRAARARKAAQCAALWASLFLIQVLFIKIQLANPSLWLLSALIWVRASKSSVLSSQS